MEDKVISFGKGIHREPSLGSVGELSECVNLYSEEGEMKLLPRMEAGRVVPDGWTAVFIHNNGAEYSNLILKNGGNLGYVNMNSEGSSSESPTTFSDFSDGNNIKDITAIGNVLVVTTLSNIFYYLWVNGKYENYTLSQIQDLDIQFALDGDVEVAVGEQIALASVAKEGALHTEAVPFGGGLTTKQIDIADAADETFDIVNPIFKKNSDAFVSGTYKAIHLGFDSLDGSKSYNWTCGNNGDDFFYVQVLIKYQNYSRYIWRTDLTAAVEKTEIWGFIPNDFFNDYGHVNVDKKDLGSITDVVLVYGLENKLITNKTGGKAVISVTTTDDSVDETTSFALHRSEENITSFLGNIDKFIKEKSVDRNKFMYPFFVRYGLKLLDGRIIRPSAPMLMVPCTGEAPNVYVSSDIEFKTSDTISKSPTISAIVAKLQYKVLNSSALSAIKSYGEIIKSVVIGVSRPLYTYISSPNEEQLLSSLYCTSKAVESKGILKISTLNSDYKVYNKAELDKKREYNAKAYHLTIPSYNKTQLIENMEGLSNFYIVSEIDINDTTLSGSATNGFVDVPMDAGTLKGLEGRADVGDDVSSLKIYAAETVYPYNNRLILGSVKETLYKGYAPQLMTGYSSPSAELASYKMAAVINITKDNQTYKLVRTANYVNNSGILFFYYPDRNAKSVTIYQQIAKGINTWAYKREITLKEHPTLNGAYWFGNFEELPIIQADLKYDWSESKDVSQSVFTTNKVISSVINNPFVIDSGTSSLVGMGSIRKLVANTKALSQGQFGQHPVFAFCTDGIWALKIGEESVFTAVQPISRDVVNNVGSITQTDNAVVFTSDKGLLMIDGSNVKQIAKSMNNVDNFDIEVLGDLLNGDYKALLVNNDSGFNEMLKTCKLVYDYEDKLLWVMPQQEYSIEGEEESVTEVRQYAISLESGEVYGYVNPELDAKGRGRSFTSYYGPKSIIPNYPQSYMQMCKVRKSSGTTGALQTTVTNCLAKFSCVQESANIRSKGWLLTRPIPFDDAYSMKMLYDMKVEKMISSGSSVKVAVYVSNDRVSWQLLRSMKARSFKWYRFAVFCNINDYDRITGLICRIDKRRQNKLR